MTLSWRTLAAMPHLPTYEAAVAHEAKVKPVRGDEYGIKPLGARKRKWECIRRVGDEIWIGYSWRMYAEGYAAKNPHYNRGKPPTNTPSLKYRPDGTVIIVEHRGYNRATQEMVGKVLLSNIWALFTHNAATWAETTQGKIRLKEGENVFKVEETEGEYIYPRHRLIPVNLSDEARPSRWVVDRAGKKAVKERYEGFRRYLMNVIRVRGERPTEDEQGQVFGTEGVNWGSSVTHTRPKIHHKPEPVGGFAEKKKSLDLVMAKMRSDNLDDWFYAAMMIMVWLPFRYTISDAKWMDNPLSAAGKEFENLLYLAHADECFTRKLVDNGKLPSYDPYQKYVKWWERAKRAEELDRLT